MFKVVGVQFDNADGENRQSILKEIYKNNKYCGRIIGATLKHVLFDGEPAIQIIEDESKKCIGWIPKEDVERFSHSKKAIIEIRKFSDSYYVRLRKMKIPSQGIYVAVKINTKRTGAKMPVYDEGAYTKVLSLVKNK